MKLYGNNINALQYKVLLTNNLFKELEKIQQENSNLIILSPLTKIKDIFNFNKNSFFFELINNVDASYPNKIVNQDFLNIFINDINKAIGFETAYPIFDLTKNLKNLIAFEETSLKNNQIEHILNYFNQYASTNIEILLIGFSLNLSKLNYEHLNIFCLTSELSNYLNWETIESLVICQQNDFFEIEHKQGLLNWLEMQTGTVLTLNDLNNYLAGKYNFNSFLIEKAFKLLK